MPTGNVIPNLQQALDCAGKCDCCNLLQQQINEINSKIANLKPVDEERIVKRAIEGSKLLMPAIAGTVIAMRLAPVIQEVGAVASIAKAAQTTAGNALNQAGSALSKLAGLAAAIFALGSTIAILNTLGGRIDAVENFATSIANDLSKALGIIGGVKNIAIRAEGKADTAQTGVNNLLKISSRLSSEIRDAKTLGTRALDKATTAERKADIAQLTGERAAQIGNTAFNTANQALGVGNTALSKTIELRQDVDFAFQRIGEVDGEVNILSNVSMKHGYEIEQLQGELSEAYNQATGAKKLAEIANTSAKNALTEAQSAKSEVTRLKGEIVTLNNKVQTVEAKERALEKELQRTLDQLGATMGILNNIAGGVASIQNTATQANTKADTAINEVSRIRNGVVSNPAVVNAVPQAINQVKQKQGDIDRQINDIKQQIKNPTGSGINTTEVTRAEFEKIKQKLGEADKVNAEGNRKLDDILGKLPAIPAATAAAVAARVPDIPRIKQAVGEATCESARGGCIAGALNDQSNGLKQDFGQKLRDLEQGLNAGANAVQLALLQRIDLKLGAQVVGGITGSLGKFYEWAHIDRALNILTFAATIHNAMMLSNDIAQTLTSALSNVLTLIGIKDKDGSPLDLGAIIGSSIENAIKGVIGAENYTELSQTFAKANRIYQSSTNVLMSVTNIGHSMTNALEIVGGMNGKIGNALRVFGVVGEKAYEWFNPQPNYHSRILRFFETAQEGANTIAAVTQAPLDVINAVTEFNNSTTELIKAVKEDPEVPNKGAKIEDAQLVKQERDEIKTLSQGALTGLSDIFNANE